MKTALIILAILLVVLSSIALIMILRYLRKSSKVDNYAAELELKERELQKRHNELDNREAMLKDWSRRQNEWLKHHKKIYANFVVLDEDENKPTMKTVGKSLSSKIGYALRREFPEILQRHDDKNNGRTVYYIDFLVTPFSENE